MLTLGKKNLLIASLCYIYIPVVIFLFGWTKLYIAVVCCAALLFGMFLLYRDYIGKQEEDVYIGKISLFVVLFFSYSLDIMRGGEDSRNRPLIGGSII